jgi:hypothetical protein
MSEDRTNYWLPVAAGVLIVAFGLFAAHPQGHQIIQQALFQAGLIYAEPMTGLD